MAKDRTRTPPPEPAPESPERLVDVLRALPERELASLVKRLGIRLDAQKRLDVPSQVARFLVAQPEIRDTSSLPQPSVELLHRIAEGKGILRVPSLPPAVEPLAARGLVFASVGDDGGVELLLPPAYLVQLRAWEGEDPRGARALMAQASFDVLSNIASHYLGRPATPPVALPLEIAWTVLSSPVLLGKQLAELAPSERRLLEAIEREGGEVLTEELLDLEREPMRLRTALGATPSRRGPGLALERRGLLIPVHPNRHVVPTEVTTLLTSETTKEREARRALIRKSVLDGDDLPRRARFAEDPAPLAIAMALTLRDHGSDVRPTVGTPKSLSTKMSQRFGQELDRVVLIGTMSRALGLWDASAHALSSPPGSLSLQDLTTAFVRAWRRGGAWDEARPNPEVFRLAQDSRDLAPIGQLREMLIEALRELGEDRWVSRRALDSYVANDARIPSITRLIKRWSDRTGVETYSPMEIVQRMIESLHQLGVVDVGDVEDKERVAIRLTPRGRVALGFAERRGDGTPSSFEGEVLELGTSARVGSVLASVTFADVRAVEGRLSLSVTAGSIGRALALGVDATTIATRLGHLAPLPDDLARRLREASAVIAQVPYVAASGFVFVEDETVRELLLAKKPTADLFLPQAVPGGLLIAPGVDVDKLVRRCRGIGVELVSDGEILTLRDAPSQPPTSRRGQRSRSS